VQILDNEQDGLLSGVVTDPVDEDFLSPFHLPLRREFEFRNATVQRNGEDRRKQRRHFVRLTDVELLEK
jgi:hypothetical protein